MKNIFVGILASMLFTSAAFAGVNKKGHAKKALKSLKCTTNCPSAANCNPAKCVNMPGGVCK